MQWCYAADAAAHYLSTVGPIIDKLSVLNYRTCCRSREQVTSLPLLLDEVLATSYFVLSYTCCGSKQHEKIKYEKCCLVISRRYKVPTYRVGGCLPESSQH